MKKSINSILYLSTLPFFFLTSGFCENPQVGQCYPFKEEPCLTQHVDSESVLFNPPEGWRLADPKALPPSVKIMVIGKGNTNFPPSINLGTENYQGNLKSYLNMIKTINESQGSEWKDLGTIRAEAGTASLSQVDTKTEWGEIRMMHVILFQDNTHTAYILTAAALKEEFPKFYKDFFKSMRSLRFSKNIYDMISDPEKKVKLQSEYSKLKNALEKVYQNQILEKSNLTIEEIQKLIFSNHSFQETYWLPYKQLLKKDYEGMGQAWETQTLNQIQNELLNHLKTMEDK